jgi:DNA-directed RNA polymerase subunit L
MNTSDSMDTYISALSEKKGMLTFTLSNVNVSIANGLRRTILSDIPTVSFRTFPHNENQADIIKNTSRFNNEIIKQRFGSIPIHLKDHSQPYDELLVQIDKQNDTNEMMYLTTGDFKIINTKSQKELAVDTINRIFPPDPYTDEYILLARLRPKISNEVPGEHIIINAKMTLQTGGDDGMYNSASCCAYINSPDKISQDDMWQKKLIELKTDKNLDPEVIVMEQSDWYNLHAKRIFKKDSFDFKIETVGVFTNIELCKKGCEVIISKLQKIKNDIAQDKLKIIMAASTLPNSYEIILQGEGYTIGKIVEFVLNREYYTNSKKLSYVGFRQSHPHDDHSFIRLAYKEPAKMEDIKSDINNACDLSIQIYSTIRENFQ